MIVKELMGREYEFTKSSVMERYSFIDFIEKRGDINLTHMSDIDKFDNWDVVYTSGDTRVLGEIKLRVYDMDRFDEGWIIEKKKYDKLIELTSGEKARESGLKPFYINIFKDGVVLWDLTTQDITWRTTGLPATNISTDKMIVKESGLLSINNGYVYKYDTDYDTRNNNSNIIMKYLYPKN